MICVSNRRVIIPYVENLVKPRRGQLKAYRRVRGAPCGTRKIIAYFLERARLFMGQISTCEDVQIVLLVVVEKIETGMFRDGKMPVVLGL